MEPDEDSHAMISESLKQPKDLFHEINKCHFDIRKRQAMQTIHKTLSQEMSHDSKPSRAKIYKTHISTKTCLAQKSVAYNNRERLPIKLASS